MALILSFLLCYAALCSAQSGSGGGTPTDDPDDITTDLERGCDGARIVYNPPIGRGPYSLIFDERKETNWPSTCRLPKTCCSKSAEEDLSVMSVTAMKEKVSRLWEDKITPCKSKLFKDALATYIDESKQYLVSLLRDAFLGFFTRDTLFDEFYNYLKNAVQTGHACQIGYIFNKLFFEIFLAVLEADPGVDTSRYPTTDSKFNLCLYNYYLETSSESTHTKFIALTRSFNRTLYYLRALKTAEDLLDKLTGLEFTPQCELALVKSTYCAQCSGHASSVVQCEGLCLNTLRGCLVDYADLYEPFKRFTTAAIRMKEYLDERVNPFKHIEQLTTGFFDVITDTQHKSHAIDQDILVRCVKNERTRREAESKSQDSTSIFSRSLFTRSTVAPPSDTFNKSAYCLLDVARVFKTAPSSLCGGIAETPNDRVCWNGNTIGSYGREILEFNRTVQQDNPEMIVCQALPKPLRVQVAYLERVTRELNIVSRSETCPEDDEDCSVDEQRCDYTDHSPVSVRVEISDPAFDTEGTQEDVGPGRNASGSGSGSGSGSARGPNIMEEEVDACLADPLLLPTATVPTPTMTEPTASSPPTKTTEVPKATPTTPSPTDGSVVYHPSVSALFLSLLLSVIVFRGVL